MLSCSDLHAYYGEVHALHGVTFEVGDEEIVAVLGANGAGKTTLLRALSGLMPPTVSGSISLDGISVEKKQADVRARSGLCQVPQGRRIFPGLTVRENLVVAGTMHHSKREALEERIARAYDIFPKLKERSGQLGWSLSGGEQQMLALGRAVVARPKVLLLDEPSLGLAPVVVEEVFRMIVRLREEEHLSILLVEQNAHMALGVADRGYVLELGRVTHEGGSGELQKDPRVRAAYLGA